MKRRLKLTNEDVEETMERLKRFIAAGYGRQSLVARALLIDQSQVSRWISEGGVPRLRTFVKLINFLETQTDPKTQ